MERLLRAVPPRHASTPEGAANVGVVAQLCDLGTLQPILSQKYTGPTAAARRIAHTLANDVIRQFTGKPGPFLTKIAFVSDRDEPRVKEMYMMDFDGESQRRITYPPLAVARPRLVVRRPADRLPVVREGHARAVPRRAGRDEQEADPALDGAQRVPFLLAGREDGRVLREREGEPGDLHRPDSTARA